MVRRKIVLLSLVLPFILSNCLLCGIEALVQPPILMDKYWIGAVGQPRRVDPARAYDTASGELIFNVYETMICFSDKPLMPAVTAEVTADKVADLSKFEPKLATALPAISADGKTWTFTVRSGVRFHPWNKADGTVVTGQILTAEDVEYTFERAFVQDQIGSPMWMFTMPLFGFMWAQYDGGYTEADEMALGHLIDNAITRSGNMVTFHFAQSWPQTAMMQIFAQTWGCIVNKAWCIEHGCWDGSFAAGWWARFHAKPSNSYSPLDNFYAAESKYTAASSVPAMCGTGPYKFNYWNKATLEYRIDRFDDYWGGWEGNHLNTIICKGVAEWSTRKMQFLAGEFDVCAVPRANMWDLLDPTDPSGHTPLPGITLYYNAPGLSNEAMLPCYHVSAESPYMNRVPTGGSPAPDLFSNVHLRRAFAYAIDFTRYLREAWFNEGIQPASWWVQGLKPDYEDMSIPKYSIDLAKVEAELKTAVINGKNIWDVGFSTYILYNLGNDQRKIAAELVRDTIMSLNAKRVGKAAFEVNVVGLDWPVFLDYEEEFFMPVFFAGWLADFADADNFVRPYMHSAGDFAYYQGYSNPHVDELIDTGIITPDGPVRAAIYMELQQIYHDDCVSIPLIQALGRAWYRDWTRGYYYNQLYPGIYFYDLWKAPPETTPDPDVVVIEEVIRKTCPNTDVIVFKWPYLLMPGQRIAPSVNVHLNEHVVNGTQWFYWANICPQAMYYHKTLYILVDSENSSKYEVIEEGWPPAVDGNSLWSDPAQYNNASYRIYSTSTHNSSGYPTQSEESFQNLAQSEESSTSSVGVLSHSGSRALIVEGHCEGSMELRNASEQWYDVFRDFGYSDNDILYLTPEERDPTDYPIDDVCTLGNLKRAVQDLSSTLQNGNDLTIFIVAHGGNYSWCNGYLELAQSSELLNDTDFADQLNTIQDGVHITVIIESCYSASSMDDLWAVKNVETIVTSTDWRSISYLASDGLDPPLRYRGISDWTWNDANPEDGGGEFSSGLIVGLSEARSIFLAGSITRGELYIKSFKTARELDAGYRNAEVLKSHYGACARPNPLLKTVFFEGDLDFDRNVNILDVAIAASAYGSVPAHQKWNPAADMDRNRQIDIVDIARIAAHYGIHYDAQY